MPTRMYDLVAKSQGKKQTMSIAPDKHGRYRYKMALKTLVQLSKIAGISQSTLHSRIQRGTYASIEEIVDTPLNPHGNRKNK